MLSVKPRRRGVTALVALMLGVAAALVGASPAWAAGYIYHPPGGSYGWYNFSIVTDWLHLQAQPQDLTSGKCYDIIFDWQRGGHFDARLARSCKDWTIRNTQVSNENDNVDLVNVQKLGVCYGTNQATNVPTSNCTATIGGMSGIDTNVGPTKFCVRAWSMKPDGTLQFFNGGDPTDCYG